MANHDYDAPDVSAFVPLLDGQVLEAWQPIKNRANAEDIPGDPKFMREIGWERFYRSPGPVNFEGVALLLRQMFPLAIRPNWRFPYFESYAHADAWRLDRAVSENSVTPDGVVRCTNRRSGAKFIMWPTETFGIMRVGSGRAPMITFVGFGVNTNRAHFLSDGAAFTMKARYKREVSDHERFIADHDRQVLREWRDGNERALQKAKAAQGMFARLRGVKVTVPETPFVPKPWPGGPPDPEDYAVDGPLARRDATIWHRRDPRLNGNPHDVFCAFTKTIVGNEQDSWEYAEDTHLRQGLLRKDLEQVHKYLTGPVFAPSGSTADVVASLQEMLGRLPRD